MTAWTSSPKSSWQTAEKTILFHCTFGLVKIVFGSERTRPDDGRRVARSDTLRRVAPSVSVLAIQYGLQRDPKPERGGLGCNSTLFVSVVPIRPGSGRLSERSTTAMRTNTSWNLSGFPRGRPSKKTFETHLKTALVG
jgi:hypothetical protein